MERNEKHPMSVFRWTFTWRYAFRHPIRIIRWFFDALGQRKQRAVNGWCMNDVYDWYNWAAYALAGLLTEISEDELIDPNRAKLIRGIAQDISDAVLDTSETEKSDEEFFRVMNDPDATREEREAAMKKSVKERQQIIDGKRNMAADAFRELGEIFFDFMS